MHSSLQTKTLKCVHKNGVQYIRAKELSLIERVIRVEEELKALSEIEAGCFEGIEKGFEVIEKCFEAIGKRFKPFKKK